MIGWMDHTGGTGDFDPACVFLLPYGVDVGYADEVLRVGIKAGPLRIWLLPKKPLTEKQRLKAEAKKSQKGSAPRCQGRKEGRRCQGKRRSMTA